MGSADPPQTPREHATPDTDARASESLVLARLRERLLGRTTGELRVGRYVLGERLGAGGMAVVHRAMDPQLGREVAIKLVRGPKDGDRLAREARALARLAHPNVVSIYDVGLAGPDEVFIAMELVEGETLARRLKDATWERALPWLVAAGRGLAAAHGVGLVHRDFKPENVMIGVDGRVRVADFGLSRTPTTDRSVAAVSLPDDLDDFTTLTRSRGIVGTPVYMAPEQHAGGPIDARTDTYAFCVVLYEAALGKRPFVATSWDGLVHAKRKGAPTELRAHVPAWLWRVIERGLKPNPDDRWPTMDALLAALGRRATPRMRPVMAMIAMTAASIAAVCGAPAWATVDARADAMNTGLAGLATSTAVLAGDAAERDGDYAGAAARFEAAFNGAVERHDDPGARGAAARLALVSVKGLRQVDAAELWIRHARVDASQDDLALRAEGSVALARGEHADALAHFETLLDHAETRGEPRALATALVDLGGAQHRLAQFEASLASRRRAIDVLLVADLADDPIHARALDGIADTLTELARPAEARVAYEEVLAQRLRTLRPDHPEIGAALQSLGMAQIDAGELATGQRLLARAETIFTSSLGAEHPQLGVLHSAIGNGYCDARDFEKARMHHERAVAIFTTAYGADHPHVGAELLNVGRVRYEQGDDETALLAFTEGRDVLERALGAEHLHVAFASHNMGQTAARLWRTDEALRHLDRAAKIRTKLLGPDHPTVAQTRAAKAAALRDLGLAEASVLEFEAAVQVLEGADNYAPTLAHARWGLALSLAEAGRDAQRADRLARQSLAFHRSIGGDADENVIEIATWLRDRARG